MSRAFGDFLAVALASVFLWSGAAKVGTPASLADTLRSLLGTSSRTAHTATIGFAVGEIVAAVLLLLLPFGTTAPVVAGAVSLVILGTSIYVLATGRTLRCGCFGSMSKKPIGWSNAAYGTGLVLLCLLLIALDVPASASAPSTLFLARAAGVTCVVVLGLVVTHGRLLKPAVANFTRGTT